MIKRTLILKLLMLLQLLSSTNAVQQQRSNPLTSPSASKSPMVHSLIFPLLRHLQSSSNETFDISVYGPCLDEHQYALFRHLMAQPICTNFVGGVTDIIIPGVTGDIPSFLASSAAPICKTLNENLMPCLHLMVPRLNAVFECLDPKLTPDGFTADDWHTTLDEVESLLCDTQDSTDKLCAEVIGSAIDPTNLLPSALSILTSCDATLGCCGSSLRTVAARVASFNTDLLLDTTTNIALTLAANAACTVTNGCSNNLQSWPTAADYAAAEERSAAYGVSTGPEIVSHEADEVQQVHLSLTTSPSSSITIMWVTQDDVSGMYVSYGSASDNLDSSSDVATSSSYTAAVASLVPSTIEWPVTYNHKVTLENLEPNTTYYYQIIGGSASSNNVRTFKTAPDSTDFSFSAAIFGDMGLYESEPTMNVLNSVASNVSFVWQVGDISYADNWLIHNVVTFGYEQMWNRFMNMIESVAESTPFMVVPGNHETECHSLVCIDDDVLKQTLGNFSAFNNRFSMPTNGVKNMWFSFDYGPVHFVTISAETSFPGAPNATYVGDAPLEEFGDQQTWLENDLRAAYENRDDVPFIVVSGHRPIYSGYSGDGTSFRGSTADLAEWLEDVFKKYRVDMYFSGHQHSYERTAPIYKGSSSDIDDSYHLNPDAPIYIVHGAGGNEETQVVPRNESTASNTRSVPSWVLSGIYDDLGVGLLTVYNKTMLKWEFKSASTGDIVDSMLLDIDGRVLPDLPPETTPPAPSPPTVGTDGTRTPSSSSSTKILYLYIPSIVLVTLLSVLF